MRRAFPRRARPVVRHPGSDRSFEFDADSALARPTDLVGDADADSHADSDADSDADPHPDADVDPHPDPDFDSAAHAAHDSDTDTDAGIAPDPDENLYRYATVDAYTGSTVDASAGPAHAHPGRDLGLACHFPAARTSAGAAGRGIPRNFGRPYLGRHATPATST